jgi:DNA-binding CsgD family transcriptional regulator
MNKPKYMITFSRALAILGSLLGLGIAIPGFITTLLDLNWVGNLFFIVLIIGNLCILILYALPKIKGWSPFLTAGVCFLQALLVYLARFSVGLYLFIPTVILLLATVLGFITLRYHFSNHSPLDLAYNMDPAIRDDVQPENSQHLTAILTSREKQVLRLLMQGLNNQEIGKSLFISQNTVRRHIYQIFRKLKCSSRTQAVILAQREGF